MPEGFLSPMFSFNLPPFLYNLLSALNTGVLGGDLWTALWVSLFLTHITIASVTIYLHRHQAHRSIDLHPAPAHFFRFWLWLTTSMQTRQWAAIHRKHHAKCETAEDPHSPQTRGIKTVFWTGAELYAQEALNEETMEKYGHGTPNDWIEKNIYTRFTWQGLALMLIADVVLFGAKGLAIWAVQMMWIPVTAAGIINGIGHYWGYRNFEAPDASTNIFPWGILIGGEELHNNHHTYPTSAKLSIKKYEFDLGYLYIRILSALGLAHIKKTAPVLHLGEVRVQADEKTLEALIANRYAMMAQFAKSLKDVYRQDIKDLNTLVEDQVLKLSNRWLHRDLDKVPVFAMPALLQARELMPRIDTMIRMREELRALWLSTTKTRNQLTLELQEWCQRAEQSGIEALNEFSLKLRAVTI
jgi:stearoyl-CoA desaturase (delta-9 desaturase)